MKKLLFMLFLTAIVLAVGCKKEETKPVYDQSSIENVFEMLELEEDVLVFNSKEAFEKLLVVFHDDKVNTRNKLKSQFPNFKSSWQTYQALQDQEIEEWLKGNNNTALDDIIFLREENDEKVVEPIVSGVLAELVNSKGFFKIGQDYYKFTEAHTYQLSEKQFLIYENTGEITEAKKVFDVRRRIISQLITAKEDVIEGRESISRCDVNYKSQRRLQGEVRTNEWGIYTNLTSQTVNQKQILFAWVRHDTDRLDLEGSISWFSGLIGPFSDTMDETCTNCSEVDDVHDWCTVLPCSYQTQSFDVDHTLQNGTNFFSCSNVE